MRSPFANARARRAIEVDAAGALASAKSHCRELSRRAERQSKSMDSATERRTDAPLNRKGGTMHPHAPAFRGLTAIATALLATAALAPRPSAAASCEELVNLALPSASIESA